MPSCQSALVVFELNVAAFPYSANARSRLGIAYADAGYSKKAKECFEAVLALNPSPSLRRTTLGRFAKLGLKFEVPEKPVVAESRLKLLTGRYALTRKIQGNLTFEDGRLVFEFAGEPKLVLEPIDECVFTSASGFTVVFTRGAEGVGREVRLEGRGMRFDGTRLEAEK